jgi:flagellar assembly protein FliH
LRAVRLLPDVVKIGVEPETALPSNQEEGQISSERSSGTSSAEKLNKMEKTGKTPSREPRSETSENDFSASDVPGFGTNKAKASDRENNENNEENHRENNQKNDFPDPLKKLNDRIAELEARLKNANTEKQGLSNKITSLEADLTGVKSSFAQKERDLAAGAEAVRQQARTDGRAQGHEEGLKSGYDTGLGKARAEVEKQYREKFSKLVAALEGISARLEENFAGLVSLNEPRMLRLWQGMLRRMLRRESNLSPEGVLKVLSDILSRLSDKNHILIYVSPEDMALLEDRLEGEFGDLLRGVKHLELKPDVGVDKGSCLVETNLGVYDARWRTQLEQIDSAVEGLFQKLGRTPEADETTTHPPEAAHE